MKSTLFALAFFSLTLPAFGQGVDPIIGTWKLNLEKSTGDILFKNFIVTVTKDGQNIILVTVEGVDAQGQAFKVVYQQVYDGMPHPSTGSLNYDSSTYNRIGNTINAVRFKQGKPTEVSQIVIVPGKTITTTTEGIAVNGQSYHYAMVSDRQ